MPLDQDALRTALEWHRVPGPLIDELVSKPLHSSLQKIMRFGTLTFAPGKAPLALVGPSGCGKTVTLAKLATRLVLDGMTPLVISFNERSDYGVSQLSDCMSGLDVPVFSASSANDLKRVFQERRDSQPVLIDTGGLDPYGVDTHAALVELRAVCRAQLCLVLPAGYDAEECADIAEIFGKARTKMMIATRLDQTRRLGSIVTAAACGLALTEAGVGSRMMGDLKPLSASFLASRLRHVGDPCEWDAAA